MQAEALMRTGAKGDMPVLVTCSFKLTWFVELRRIVVRGDIVEPAVLAEVVSCPAAATMM